MSASEMVEVTQEEFYEGIGNLNVHPRIVGSWPYRHEFRMNDSGRELKGVVHDGPFPKPDKYWLVPSLAQKLDKR